MAKSWAEKTLTGTPHVEIIEKSYAGIPAGGKMLVSSPPEVRDYIRAIPSGQTKTIAMLRSELARRHDADGICPMSASIFIRIVSEAAWDEHLAGAPLNEITPFWRLVGPEDKIAGRLRCGSDFLRAQRAAEGTI